MLMRAIAINYKIGQLFRKIYGWCSIQNNIVTKTYSLCKGLQVIAYNFQCEFLLGSKKTYQLMNSICNRTATAFKIKVFFFFYCVHVALFIIALWFSSPNWWPGRTWFNRNAGTGEIAQLLKVHAALTGRPEVYSLPPIW